MGKLTINGLEMTIRGSVLCSFIFVALFFAYNNSLLSLIIWQKIAVIVITMFVIFAISFYLITLGHGLHYDPNYPKAKQKTKRIVGTPLIQHEGN